MLLSLLVIFVSFIIGIKLKKFDLVNVFNNLNIYLFLPSLILAYIPSIKLYQFQDTLILLSSPWILFLLSYLYFRMINIKMKLAEIEFKTLVLVNGLGNTAFLGYPLVKALAGDEAMPSAIILDQMGTFLILSSLATIFASYGQMNRKNLILAGLKKIITFPPFISLVMALFLNQNIFLLSWSHELKYLSLPLTPLAIMVLGMQLNFDRSLFRKYLQLILSSLVFKLMLFPIIIFLIYQHLTNGVEFQTIMLQSAMAPMFSSLILVNRFQLKADLAAMTIFCGVIVSLITVPLWSMIL